jgi:hypothetical protein
MFWRVTIVYEMTQQEPAVNAKAVIQKNKRWAAHRENKGRPNLTATPVNNVKLI